MNDSIKYFQSKISALLIFIGLVLLPAWAQANPCETALAGSQANAKARKTTATTKTRKARAATKTRKTTAVTKTQKAKASTSDPYNGETTGSLPVKLTRELYEKLEKAAASGDTDEMQRLLEEGPSVDDHALCDGLTLLHKAVQSKNLSEVKKLIFTHGANVNVKDSEGTEALHSAALGGCYEIVELLLREGADVNAIQKVGGGTPLHLAALGGNFKVVELLIARGADVNAKNNEGSTPLHYAAEVGHNDTTVEILLKNGATVNVSDSLGLTPLHLAVGHFGRSEGIVALLLEHGADVHARDRELKTPLHWSARHENHALTKRLLTHDPDVNAKDKATAWLVFLTLLMILM